MHFRQLTQFDGGRKVWVNMAQVLYMERGEFGNYTAVTLAHLPGRGSQTLKFIETPEQIMWPGRR